MMSLIWLVTFMLYLYTTGGPGSGVPLLPPKYGVERFSSTAASGQGQGYGNVFRIDQCAICLFLGDDVLAWRIEGPHIPVRKGGVKLKLGLVDDSITYASNPSTRI